VNFPWNWAYFQKHPVKSRIFLHELGWSLGICTEHALKTVKYANRKTSCDVFFVCCLTFMRQIGHPFVRLFPISCHEEFYIHRRSWCKHLPRSIAAGIASRWRTIARNSRRCVDNIPSLGSRACIAHRKRKCAEIIANDTINLVFKTAISVSAISNRNSFWVLFDKVASVYFI